jgi:triacylglycerol esterase/lipase EstA (alpha/beta hydrolase family)
MNIAILKSRNGKVTIIAHSNGGLLAKALLYKLKENYDYDTLLDKIDRVVFVAVPQVGTASAVPAMLHGYDQSLLWGKLMDKQHARELGRNMRSAYSLLPSQKYMESITTPPVVFDNTIDFENIRK